MKTLRELSKKMIRTVLAVTGALSLIALAAAVYVARLLDQRKWW